MPPTIWERIKVGDKDARDELLVKYLPLTEYAAKSIAQKLPNYVDVEDLASNGVFGLMDAIEKFDPERGYKFKTYAMPRIRGAILDSLRGADWVSRSVRSRAREISRAESHLEQELGRQPTIKEMCEVLDMSEEEILNVQAAHEAGQIFNLDSPTGHTEDFSIGDTLSQDTGDLSQLMAAFDRDAMVAALYDLPEREQVTIGLHYYMGFSLAQIGELFEVTESRVCQIHTAALKQLRAGIL